MRILRLSKKLGILGKNEYSSVQWTEPIETVLSLSAANL